MITYGSVCSGIEAATVAWHHMGWKPAWLAEVDVAASAVLAHHYGATAPRYPMSGTEKAIKKLKWGSSIVNYGDMNELPAAVARGEAEAPDILCGGTPCQSFSLAGLRGGLDDARGQLTLTFIKLADAIDAKREANNESPAVIFWENVPGILTHKDNPFGCFLAGLAGEDVPLQPPGRKWENAGVVLGPKRAVAWVIKDAQYFGVAQRRRRLFVVASARNDFDPVSVCFEFDGVRRDTTPSREASTTVAALTANGVGTCGADDNQGQAGHLVPFDRRHSLIGVVHGTQDPCASENLAFALGRNNGGENVIAFSCKDFGADASEDISPTLRSMNNSGSHANGGGQIAVAFALRGREGGAMPEYEGEVTGALRSASGGSSRSYVAQCVTGHVTHTLKADGFDASEDGTGRGQPIVPCFWNGEQVTQTLDAVLYKGQTMPEKNRFPARLQGTDSDIKVRRLMPIECERLQGFPDHYTLVPVGAKSAADGPRYKQLGNSWAVPCARWFGERIEAQLKRTVSPEAVLLWSLLA